MDLESFSLWQVVVGGRWSSQQSPKYKNTPFVVHAPTHVPDVDLRSSQPGLMAG